MIRIKELRESKGLSQAGLAKELGLSPNTICQYERGTREPDIQTIIKICKYFDCSSDYLIGLKDE